MPAYVAVRAISRSQNVRIGNQKVNRAPNVWVDLETPKLRRDLERFQALGAIIKTRGSLAKLPDIVTSGAVVSQGVSAADLIIACTAGALRRANDAATVAIVANAALTIGAADATNPRLDNIIVDTTTGVVSVQAGTAAAIGVLVAPAVAAGKIKVAEVFVAATVTAITDANIFDWTTERGVVAA